MSKLNYSPGPMPDPSFARRRTNATGPKIRLRPQLTNRAIWAGMDGFETVVTMASGVAIAAALAILLFGVMAAKSRFKQDEHWSKLTVDYMAERPR